MGYAFLMTFLGLYTKENHYYSTVSANSEFVPTGNLMYYTDFLGQSE